MTTFTTLDSNDDDGLSLEDVQVRVNMGPLLGLLLAILSSVISVGLAFLLYRLVF
jgi:hypothetical protein